MISFNIRCKDDHEFEIWFRDSAEFESQKEERHIVCPVCGSRKVEKALSAPNISTGRGREQRARELAAAAYRQMLVKMRETVESNCDYVGPAFAEEARKIHYGEVEKRDIYGEATDEDVQDLVEEGVEFGRIPWVPRTES